MAADGNPAVQMMLPMAEMIGWLRKGVGEWSCANARSRAAPPVKETLAWNGHV